MKIKTSVEEALKSYNKYKDIYENGATPADKNKAFQVMVKAAEYIQRDYNASQMFNEDGSVNTEAYQKQCCNTPVLTSKLDLMKEKF